MIGKEFLVQIDRCLNIETVILKIDQTDPFLIRKMRKIVRMVVIR